MIVATSVNALIAPVECTADGEWIVRSPGVGLWFGGPLPGELVGEGSAVGALRQLNRVHLLKVGAGAAGRVADHGPRARAQFVEYGQELFRLRALREQDALETPAVAAAGGLAAGARAVVAPTDGVFYRKSAPDAPLLAKVGDRLRHAQPIGLIEVMKTFNQILYEAPDPALEAEVIEVRAEDSAEVRAGDVLLVVRDA